MAWYKTGTINVTNGATSVTGVGTRWASNARVGDGIRLPDGKAYEVVNIASETTLGIFPAYAGPTASSQQYVIVPVQGYVKESADRLREITDGMADITQDVEDAQAAASAAQTSASNASTSASAARTSELAAKTSETNANTSRTQAASSATAAAGSATTASTQATNAGNSAAAAKTSETNSKTSETNAKTSETNAATSRTNAANSATAALASQNAAKTSETNAKTSETNAKASETAAGNSQTAAASSATAAASSATASANSATASQTARTGSETARTQAQTAEANAKKWATNPVDSAVETGSYSAFHWASKAKESADAAAGVTGARLTSIASAVLAVNDMLIADTTTTMAKIATGATGRSMLGAATPAAGRTVLGLGTIATFDLTQSNQDNTANRITKTGDFGWGASAGISGPVCSNVDDMTLPNGLYVCSSSTTGSKPPTQTWGSLLITGRANQTGTGSRVVQTWFNTDSGTAISWTRNGFNGTWGEWIGTSATTVGLGTTSTITGISTIAAGTDLNTIVISGFYGQTSNTNATLALNYPVTKAGSLTVLVSGSQITTQQYQEYDNGTTWVRARYNTTWSAWKQLWDSNTLQKTIGSSDATVGRVMTTGDFGLGLGGSGVAPQLTNIDSTTQSSGMFSVRGSSVTSGTYPSGASTYGYMFVQRYNNENFAQIYMPTTSHASGVPFEARMYYRTYVTAAGFTKWERVFSTDQSSAWGLAENISNTSAGGWASNIDDFDLKNGLWICDSTTTGVKPASQTWGVVLNMGRNFSVGRVVQTWYQTDVADGSAPRSWSRLNYGKTWSPWVEQASLDTLQTYGIGTNTAPMFTDLNTKNVGGLWRSAVNATNAPANGLAHAGINLPYNSTGIPQIAVSVGGTVANNRMYFRSQSGTNTAWKEVVTTDGSADFTGTVTIKATNQLRFKNEGSSTAPAVLHRVDASNYYMLLTNESDQDGNFNALRPFRIGLTTGQVEIGGGFNVAGAATCASPSSGDRSNRIATTTWMGSELGRWGVGADVQSLADAAGTNATGFYYYANAVSPYPAFAFVMKARYSGNRGFEIANIPYTDRFFGRSWNSDGTARTPVELANKVDVEPTVTAGTSAQYYRGDKQFVDFNAAVRGAALSGISTSNSAAVVAGDSFIIGMGKLQSQLNNIVGDNNNITSIRAPRYFDPIVVANATGAYACNLQNTSTFELTLTGNTTLSFSNIPTILANTLMTVVITVKQGATARTLTLPTGTTIIAPGGSITTPAANKQQDYIFTTKNGTAWEVRAGAST